MCWKHKSAWHFLISFHLESFIQLPRFLIYKSSQKIATNPILVYLGKRFLDIYIKLKQATNIPFNGFELSFNKKQSQTGKEML
ncbi:unnamed protein product [Blepharisma stoltei]|uniref:Uncharacterized protein n=1 Tax=Blepharisma stoltei TaxID=1481888 RepID=A0AAU9K5N9_9CILI|nr:unnamed protein product [Blepharisma stoltei]